MAIRHFTAPQIGARLRDCRKARGLTQIAVAKQAGISKGFYSEVEQGAEISVSRLARIAGVLDVSLDRLVRGDSSDPLAQLESSIAALKSGADSISESDNHADLRTLWRGKSIAYETVLGAIAKLRDASPPAPIAAASASDGDPYDTPFWRFVRETAAKADELPHWKWRRQGCSCADCNPPASMTERGSA